MAHSARASSASGTLASANTDLQAGRADAAIAKLSEALQSDPNSAEANNMLCRVEFTLQQFNEAAGHCEKAVSLDPQNARYHLWLARTFGERASRASWTSAFSMAKRTREEFETAVKLDPRNIEALSDLGEFYTDAPGVVGGGTDKAEGIAKQLDPIDPSRAHHLRGLIAEKQKDLGAAEKEFKAAISGNRSAVAWTELASFYRRHERWADMESAVASAAAAAAREKQSAQALFNGASILGRSNRRSDLAIKLYESYLASPGKSEEAPAFDALTRLAKVRKQAGDTAGAQRDRAAALALAHDYKPAREAKF
jgi:tetratricopeptide (TPR) repeat protein